MLEPAKRYVRKPRRCPNCKHTPVATIHYGFPSDSGELQRDLSEGRKVLRGCVIRLDGSQPKWKCTNCEIEYFPHPAPLPDPV